MFTCKKKQHDEHVWLEIWEWQAVKSEFSFETDETRSLSHLDMFNCNKISITKDFTVRTEEKKEEKKI